MERFLVAFMAVAVLLSGTGHSRAGYKSVYQAGGPLSSEEQFLNLIGVAAAFEDRLVGEAVDHRGQVFIVTSLASTSNGDRRFFSPTSGSGPNDLANVRAGELAFLVDSGCLGGGARPNSLFGVGPALPKDIYDAEPFIQHAEISSGDDPFLATFGTVAAQTQ